MLAQLVLRNLGQQAPNSVCAVHSGRTIETSGLGVDQRRPRQSRFASAYQVAAGCSVVLFRSASLGYSPIQREMARTVGQRRHTRNQYIDHPQYWGFHSQRVTATSIGHAPRTPCRPVDTDGSVLQHVRQAASTTNVAASVCSKNVVEQQSRWREPRWVVRLGRLNAAAIGRPYRRPMSACWRLTQYASFPRPPRIHGLVKRAADQPVGSDGSPRQSRSTARHCSRTSATVGDSWYACWWQKPVR